MNESHIPAIDSVIAAGEIPTIINGEVAPAMNRNYLGLTFAIFKAQESILKDAMALPNRNYYWSGEVQAGEWVCEISLRRK